MYGNQTILFYPGCYMEQKWRKATEQKITLNTKLKRLFELLKMLASAASAVLVVLQTVIAKYFTYKRGKKASRRQDLGKSDQNENGKRG